MLIVVAAGEHPELDDWVREQARAEAAKSGVELGEYLGREDVLPEPAGLCCHVFQAGKP
jgi:hypothetical protein